MEDGAEFSLLQSQIVGHLGAAVTALHFDLVEDLLWVGDEAVGPVFSSQGGAVATLNGFF